MKGMLPTATELEEYVMKALRNELDGEAYYKDIDNVVRENLSTRVYVQELRRTVTGFRKFAVASRTAHARRTLRMNGEITPSSGKRGYWRLTSKHRTLPKKRTAGTVQDFAQDTIDLLKSRRVSTAAIDDIYKLLVKYQLRRGEVHPDHTKKLETEQKATKYVLDSEPDWHVPIRRNNPGFDLFRTASRGSKGRKTAWCEIKGLKGRFSQIEMTITEFKKALKEGQAYSLYIVENVDAAKPNLIKIHNPAGNAERITFGRSGWK